MTSPENNSKIEVARSSVIYLGSQLAARAINFVFFIMLARNLPVSDFGIFSLAITIVVLLDIVIDLGFSRYAMREVSKQPDKSGWYISVLLPFKLAAATFVYVVLAIIALSWSDPNENGTIFLVASLAIFFTAPSMVFENILQAHQKFSLISFAHLALSVTQIVIGFLVLFFGGSTLAIALIFGVSNLLYCMIMVRGIIRLQISKVHPRRLKSVISLLKPAFPYLCSTLIIMLALRGEFLILGHFGSSEDLAIYGMGTKIIEATLLLPIVFGAVLAPRFAIAHSRSTEVLTTLYRSSVEVLLLISVPCAVIAYGFTPIAVWILPDRSFVELESLLKLLFIGYPAACLYLLNTSILFGAVNQIKPLILLGTLGVLQLAINCTLQNSFALWGAAYSFLSFMVIAAVTSTVFILTNYVNANQFGKAIIAPFAGMLGVIITFLTIPLSTEVAKLPFALAAYGIAILIARRLLPGGPQILNFEP
jgi:O-antigen/teichoic acid export membrane protein